MADSAEKRSIGVMQDLTQPASTLSFIVMLLSMLPSMVIILRPSPLELFVFLFVDFWTAALLPLWERPMFRWLYPDSQRFFPRLASEIFADQSLTERLALLEALMSFPRRRALFVWLGSYPKVVPAWLVVLSYWNYPHSGVEQFVLSLVWFTPTSLGLYGFVYFDSHEYVSRLIAQLHARHDWTETFRCARLREDQAVFVIHEAACALVMFACMLLVQMVHVRSSLARGADPWVGVLVIGLAGLLGLSRLWYVSRRVQRHALGSLLAALEGQVSTVSQTALPLHSMPVLARFEQIFNELLLRLRAHERELAHFVSRRTEEQRFASLAESAALVVHDLSLPLQEVMKSARKLADERARVTQPECLDRITLHAGRSLDLVQSLRTYLRASTPPEQGAPFGEVHGYVMRILAARFPGNRLARVSRDPALDALVLKTTRADLIHILVNILGNSLENLIANGVEDPEITLRLVSRDGSRVTLELADNGSGLSRERFEEMTGFASLASGSHSLGLRLVRRLVERNGGDLAVISRVPGERGTAFHLELEVA